MLADRHHATHYYSVYKAEEIVEGRSVIRN